MKKSLILLGLLLLLSAAGRAINVPSELKGARVFLWGAEISRSASAQLNAGVNEIVFSGLPADIDGNSIQVGTASAVTILSVSHRMNFLESPQHTSRVRMLTDSLDLYTREIASQQGLLKVYEEEELLLLANKSIGGGDTGVKVADLRAMADFFRTRLAEVKNLQIDTRRRIDQLQKRQQRIRTQLGEAGQQRTPVSEIVLSVTAPRATTARFDFSYITRRARWSASYDIRAMDTSKPVELLMKASIAQNTNEDWTNIPLVLSTANPLDARVVPTLNTWFLHFMEPAPQMMNKLQGRARGVEMEMLEEYVIVDDDVDVSMDAFAVIASQTTTTREYTITAPFTIRSGAESQMLEVHRKEVAAAFAWYAVPRVDKDAYLLARLSGWEELVVLPGETGIFFENAFVGKTFIDPAQVRDTLEVSMGIDRGVSIERLRVTDQSRRSFLGRRNTETVAWKINIRNNKNRTINLEVRDQVPVSTHADMQISVEERSGASYDENTGMLVWRMELTAGQTAERNFRYTVRYPADKKVIVE
jgi:uncharacterized protein (TIGR02231 family)